MDMDLLFFSYADQNDDLPGVQQERAAHRDLLKRGHAKQRFMIRQEVGDSITSLTNDLTQYRESIYLFHYSGHAGRDILALEDQGSARAQGIAHLLAQCKNLQLVVLNGCATAGQVQWLRDAGVEAVIIATNTTVNDLAAFKFSQIFYSALDTGTHALQAFEQAVGTALSIIDTPIYRSRDLLSQVKNDHPIWGMFATEAVNPHRITLPGSRLTDRPPLPVISHFIGRKNEMKKMVELITTSDDPVAIPVMGFPGMGKSTLCVQVIRQEKVIEKYPVNRYFVSCEGATNTELVWAAIAKAMGIPISQDLKKQILNTLNKAPTYWLLIMQKRPLTIIVKPSRFLTRTLGV